jgi:hypothetical protein
MGHDCRFENKSTPSLLKMTQNSPPLDAMTQALRQCEQGDTTTAPLIRIWRQEASQLNLPQRYSDVLNGQLDRMESSALFSEESCSFSHKDQLAALKLWLEKATAQLHRQQAVNLAQAQPSGGDAKKGA